MRTEWLALCVGAFVLMGVCVTAENWNLSGETRQTWKMNRTDDPAMVQFTLKRSSHHNSWATSSDVPVTDFRNFSVSDLDRGGQITFDLVQDSGTLHFVGRSGAGSASGSFTFTPNPNFSDQLERLGYGRPTEEQVFSMMMSRVGLDFARAVHDAGLNASLRQLVQMGIHGIDTNFIRDARQAGYSDFTADNYIELKIHGVDVNLLRDLKANSFNLPARDIVELKIHGVDSNYIRALHEAGYDIASRKVVEMKIHGVDANYLNELKNYGLKPTPEDLVQLRIHGINPAYLKALRDNGYGALNAQQLTDLSMHGVSPDFIAQVHNLGYQFSSQDLITLRNQGVDGNYLKKLKDAGMRNLTAEQIAKLRIHGVE